MRIIFMGTPQFAVASLNELLAANMDVAAVVTACDKPAGRGLNVRESPVKKVAIKENLTILQPAKLSDPYFIRKLSEFKADVITVVAFRILPEAIFNMPPKGTVNLHGSLLPKYRGAAPINWAIINGEKETGVTTFFIQKEVDKGNIIDTRSIPITPNMTAGELHDIMAEVGANLLLETIGKIEAGNVITKKQNEALSTKAPKIHREDCLINFDQPVQNVHNFIRGLSPTPAAHTYVKGKQVRLFSSEVVNKESRYAKPATITKILDFKKLIVQCQRGSISVQELQPADKRRMLVEEYLRGHDLTVGEIFGQKY